MFYVGDCFEVMAALPSGSVDLVVTDPPYRTISGGTKSTLAAGWSSSVLHKNDGKIFEHNDVKIEDYMAEFYRLLKPSSHCYVMTNNLNLRALLNAADMVGFGFHNLLGWEKNTRTANRWYMKSVEYTGFFYKKPAKRIVDASCGQLFKADNIRNKAHPTEKPVALFEHYIQNSSAAGEVILDPFAGSGTTAIAAMNCGRDWICIERDENYAAVAQQRIAEAMLS